MYTSNKRTFVAIFCMKLAQWPEWVHFVFQITRTVEVNRRLTMGAGTLG